MLMSTRFFFSTELAPFISATKSKHSQMKKNGASWCLLNGACFFGSYSSNSMFFISVVLYSSFFVTEGVGGFGSGFSAAGSSTIISLLLLERFAFWELFSTGLGGWLAASFSSTDGFGSLLSFDSSRTFLGPLKKLSRFFCMLAR